MNKKLFAFDLDGTLLSNGKILTETKEAIIQLKQDGHKVCILTGRSWKSTKDIYNELELDTVVSNYNGSYLHNPTDYDFIPNVITLDIAATMNILNDKHLQQVADNVAIEMGNKLVLKHKPSKVLSDFLHTDDYNKVKIGLNSASIKRAPIGVLVLIKKEYAKDIDAIVKYFNGYWGDIAEFSSWTFGENGDVILDIMNKDSHKGTTLVQMARYYDIPMSDVVAFGDGGNDMTMLNIAGTGVAMSNANASVKAVANVITEDTNVDNGIVNFLNWFKSKGHTRITTGIYDFNKKK